MNVHRPPVAVVREDRSTGVVLVDIVVTPSAARTEIRGVDPWRHGIAVRVAAKPSEGAANAELLRFLARHLHVPPSSLRIVAGHRGHRKTVAVQALSKERVEAQLGLRGD